MRMREAERAREARSARLAARLLANFEASRRRIMEARGYDLAGYDGRTSGEES